MLRELFRHQPRRIDSSTGALFRDIERSGALPQEVSAADAATAVLCTLVTRLGDGDGRQVVSSVPPSLRRLIERATRGRERRLASLDRPTFVYEVGRELRIETDAAFRLTHAVFAAVRARLPAREIDDVEAMLPYDLAELWRS